MNYVDTSALIKHLAQEAGSQHVEALIMAEPRLATSKVGYAEVHAALARKLREGALTPATHQTISYCVAGDVTAVVEPMSDSLLQILRDHSGEVTLADNSLRAP